MENNSLLQTVVDEISEPIITLDRNLSIKLFNRAAKDYYQIKTQDVIILRDYLTRLIPFVEEHTKVNQDFELFGMSYPEFREDIFKLLDNVEHGSSRINFIVSGLREFSRKKDKKRACLP